MNVSCSLPIQPHPVVVHDAGRIFNHHSDASVTVLSALNVHDVENVLLTPISLERRASDDKERKFINMWYKRREFSHIK